MSICNIILYSTYISEEELEHHIVKVKETMPDIGERMTIGALRATVPRHRVRRALNNIDPIGSALRWKKADGNRRQSAEFTQYQDEIRSGTLVRWYL